MHDRKPNPAPPLKEYADVGDTVQWFAGGNPTLRPLTGTVIEKSPGGGPGTANLTIVTFTAGAMAVQEGVLHMENDRCRREGNQGGGWRHVPSKLLFNEFMLAAGLLKWDGDETYVADPDANPVLLGEALAEVMARFGDAKKPKRENGGPGRQAGSPPPPPPPPPPAT